MKAKTKVVYNCMADFAMLVPVFFLIIKTLTFFNQTPRIWYQINMQDKSASSRVLLFALVAYM